MSYPRKIAIVPSIFGLSYVTRDSSIAAKYPQSGGTFIEQIDEWVFTIATKSTHHGDVVRIYLTRETAAELIVALRKITG